MGRCTTKYESQLAICRIKTIYIWRLAAYKVDLFLVNVSGCFTILANNTSILINAFNISCKKDELLII